MRGFEVKFREVEMSFKEVKNLLAPFQKVWAEFPEVHNVAHFETQGILDNCLTHLSN